jgi:hypothetical protein
MSLPKKDLIKFIDSISDNWGSIRNKMSTQGAGHRLYPSRTPKNDAASKARLDQGEKLPKDSKKDEDEPNDSYNVNVQANNQGSVSHDKLFTIQVKPSNTKEEVRAKLKNAAQSRGLI